MKRKIITVQSQVATGYVGNNIAVLALQLHGFDPVQIPTVLLSNHIEYPHLQGRSLDKGHFSELFLGILQNRITEQADYLISGFVDDENIIAALADFISQSKKGNSYQYIYDPAFGDYRSGGFYFNAGIARSSVERLLPLCDVLTPNQFELDYILGQKVTSQEIFTRLIKSSKLLASKLIVATGMTLDNDPAEHLQVLMYHDGHVSRFRTRRIPIEVIGTGDLFAAVLTSHLNRGEEPANAVMSSMEFVSRALEYCLYNGFREFNAEVLIQAITEVNLQTVH